MLTISSQFDSGAIVVVDASRADSIQLKLRTDNASVHSQWFHFRLTNAKNQKCTIRIENASESTYPDGWVDYQAVASYDHVNWFRVPTTYDGRALKIAYEPSSDVIWFAYFEPYSWERHQILVSQMAMQPNVTLERLGVTPDGHDFDLLCIGEPQAGKQNVWLTARQHPGETMAEWFMEGFFNELLNPDSATGRALLKNCVFYIVPNMNPDGSVRGNLRTNAKGTDLNRQWLKPSLEASPEVFWVREKMSTIGVDLFLDIHGDESIPYVFVAGCESNPSFSDKQLQLQNAFKSSLMMATPDFQDEYGYGERPFNQETLKLASNWVGEEFDCLAYTLEMPFKDTDNSPVPLTGWNGKRSMRFGANVLIAIEAVLQPKTST